MTYLHDVSDYGAVGDGITSDTHAFISAVSAATQQGGKVVAAGIFKIDGIINVTCHCDFSQATLVMDKGRITITYTADYLASHQLTLHADKNDFDKTGLTSRTSNMKGVVSEAVIAAYENAFVHIHAPDVYIYRSGDLDAPQYKSTVSHMSKYGRLTYPLNFDYSTAPGVQLILRRLPESRLLFHSPAFHIIEVHPAGDVLSVYRDLVDVVGVTITHFTGIKNYYRLTGCLSCYDVTFSNTSLPGYGVTNSEPGVSQDVRYDFIFDRALKLRLEGLNSATGWKTIDGNHSRDIVIKDANIDGFHGHFNVSDVSVVNCRIADGGLSFGTNAEDASITIRDCTFKSGAVSMRSDYGELKGSIIIDNCQFESFGWGGHPRSTGALLTLEDDCIRKNNQPHTYSLPDTIVIRNTRIKCRNDYELIKITSGNVYSATRRLNAPRTILIEHIDAESEQRGKLIFNYGFVPFNYLDASSVKVTLRNIVNRDARLFVNFRCDARDKCNQLQTHLHIDNVDNLNILLMGGIRSRANIIHSRLHGLDTYDGGSSFHEEFRVSDCTFEFDANLNTANDFIIATTLQKILFSHCLFDAHAYKAEKGTPLVLESAAHIVSDCMSIDCYSATSQPPLRGLRSVLPARGDPNCFTLDADGFLSNLK